MSGGEGSIWPTVLSSNPSRFYYLAPDKADAARSGPDGAPSALLIDASGDVGHAYAAQTTNRMFIVGKDGLLLYAGAVDDSQTMDVRKVLQSHNYVRSALEDILAGRPVRIARIDHFGCAIAYSD